MSRIMPVVFVGHGSPENAFEENGYTDAWKRIAAGIPRPGAIVCVSAHWTTSVNWRGSGTAVTAAENPRTIHDFYGFPRDYYRLRYPAKGSPVLAERIAHLARGVPVALDHEWGLDHGTWSVLVKMYPEAGVPVVQLSIDENLPLAKHVSIGRTLRELRREGVLVLGSGNIVHNLMALKDGAPYPWAVDFDEYIKACLLKRDIDGLVRYHRRASASEALPTNEHFLPLLYAAGAASAETPQFLNESFFAGSVSMRCVVYGDTTIA